jgi:hypothetical protein
MQPLDHTKVTIEIEEIYIFPWNRKIYVGILLYVFIAISIFEETLN